MTHRSQDATWQESPVRESGMIVNGLRGLWLM